MVGDGKQIEPQIKEFKENHTDTTVHFTVTAEKARIDEWEQLPKGGLFAKFKLTGSLTNSNMHLFDPENCITKFERPEDIMHAFFELRMEFYNRRKQLLLKKIRKEQGILSNKARFIEEVCSGDLEISNRKKLDILQDLKERRYTLFNDMGEEEEAAEDDNTDSLLSKGYDYLLGMKIWSLTFERAEELKLLLAEKSRELNDLEATSPSTIWLRDLDAVEAAMDERDTFIEEAAREEAEARDNSKKRSSKTTKRKTANQNRSKARKPKSKLSTADKPGVREPPVACIKEETMDEQTGLAPTSEVTNPTEQLSLAERMSNLLDLSANKTLDKEDHFEGGKVSQAKKRPSPKNTSKISKEPKKRKTKPVEDSEESDDDLSDDDLSLDESIEMTMPEARSRSKRAAAKEKVTYDYAMSSSEGEWSEGDY